MKRVLIITYSFPPLNNIAARRFGEIVPYLEKYGWKPTVLTTESVGTLPIKLKEEQIIRYGKHPQKALKIDKSTSKGIKNKIIDFKRNLGYNLRLFDRTYFNWYKKIKKREDILEIDKFDLIVASFGPCASLYLGNYFSKKHNIPWIADFRDLGALYKDKSFNQNFFSKFIDKKIEKYLVKKSIAITSIGNTLAEILGNEYNKDSYAIFNGWSTANESTAVKECEDKYIYYAGRFYPHQMKSVYKIINMLNEMKNIKLVIRSLGPENLNVKILNFAQKLGVADRVRILEPSDQETVLRESQLSLVNLVVEDLDKEIYWKKGTLTGKLLGLLPLKPPILAVARDDSEIGYVLNKTNKGRLCSTEFEIVDFLMSIDNYDNPNFKEISYYSKQNQAKLLTEIFDSIIGCDKN